MEPRHPQSWKVASPPTAKAGPVPRSPLAPPAFKIPADRTVESRKSVAFYDAQVALAREVRTQPIQLRASLDPCIAKYPAPQLAKLETIVGDEPSAAEEVDNLDVLMAVEHDAAANDGSRQPPYPSGGFRPLQPQIAIDNQVSSGGDGVSSHPCDVEVLGCRNNQVPPPLARREEPPQLVLTVDTVLQTANLGQPAFAGSCWSSIIHP